MRVVIDGLPISGMSLAVVVEHVLDGWQQLGVDDELHIALGPRAELPIPDSVVVHRVEFGRNDTAGRLRAQSFELPRLCRKVGADALFGVLPTTTLTPLPCPRVITAHDLRHELRPEQFSRRARTMRTVSYSAGFRQADGVVCVSERTKTDLLASRPWLRSRALGVALHGADHVDSWPTGRADEQYAIAFGQYGNKNVDLVLAAWTRLRARGDALPLVVVGLAAAERAAVQARVDRLGLSDAVTLLPWLSDGDFRERFASASLVVFPSDFEGFGLPVVEAMRLRIPVVITPDQALLEVSGGHATVTAGSDATALADAVTIALDTPPERIEAACRHTDDFTWARAAAQTRATVLAATGARAEAVAGGQR
ncbi:MAG: hypothetical protein JWO57_3811 [Pseudonocardiales bacterium]|nr:hypothetical protein [Pseudonocardiales bacterium]